MSEIISRSHNDRLEGYLCDPHSPWQRSSIEMNGRPRRVRTLTSDQGREMAMSATQGSRGAFSPPLSPRGALAGSAVAQSQSSRCGPTQRVVRHSTLAKLRANMPSIMAHAVLPCSKSTRLVRRGRKPILVQVTSGRYQWIESRWGVWVELNHGRRRLYAR